MCVQWCNCVTTSQDVGTGAELIRTMLRTHAHSHTLVHLWREATFLSQRHAAASCTGAHLYKPTPSKILFPIFPYTLSPSTLHMSSGHMHLFILVSQQASVGLSGRPKTGILLSVWVPLHILPPFLLHVLVCVCMCIVYVQHLGRLLGHAWINGHESMLVFITRHLTIKKQ